ncbi:glycosyltransferase family 39 protein [Myxococcota bacterium]|nr:glycosyltransferase family 39 protein [Myxococcota bacterium]
MPDAPPAAPEPDARRAWGLALLVVGAVVLRLGTLAQSPFDIDAALLTAGVRHFDPTAMQPHPPGYAGLIGLARLLPVEPGLALRLLSVGSVVPFVVFTAAIARRVGAEPLTAAALVAMSPVTWLYGVTENAYAVGAAGAAWTAWSCLRAQEKPSHERAAWVGLALGVTGAMRPSLLVFLAPMACWGVGLRGLPALAAGATLPTATWIGASAAASGGLFVYLDAVVDQFGVARSFRPERWRLHQLHQLGVYLAQCVGGGALLTLWLRRAPGPWALFALWIGVPFTFHALVYLAKPGYLLCYLPALAVILASSAAPTWARIVAPTTSALFFLLADPIDLDRDPSPRKPFAEKSLNELVRAELSFFAMTSLHRVRDQERANHAYVALIRPLVEPGRTLVIHIDRWEVALADALLTGVSVRDSNTDQLGVPAGGARLIVLSWASPGPGFRLVRDAEGYAVWVRDLSVAELPIQIAWMRLVPAW